MSVEPPRLDPPTIEMTPEGEFRDPPRTPLPVAVARVALGVAVLAGVVALLILAFWAALVLIPVALIAGLVAWGAIRLQLWRARR